VPIRATRLRGSSSRMMKAPHRWSTSTSFALEERRKARKEEEEVEVVRCGGKGMQCVLIMLSWVDLMPGNDIKVEHR
jgi:hypothetical protein